MNSPLNLDNVFSDDHMLKRAFAWLARIGSGPTFGSRPIGWYQAHHCHALDILRAMNIYNPVCKGGVIMERGQRGLFITIDELYRQADTLARK